MLRFFLFPLPTSTELRLWRPPAKLLVDGCTGAAGAPPPAGGQATKAWIVSSWIPGSAMPPFRRRPESIEIPWPRKLSRRLQQRVWHVCGLPSKALRGWGPVIFPPLAPWADGKNHVRNPSSPCALAFLSIFTFFFCVALNRSRFAEINGKWEEVLQYPPGGFFGERALLRPGTRRLEGSHSDRTGGAPVVQQNVRVLNSNQSGHCIGLRGVNKTLKTHTHTHTGREATRTSQQRGTLTICLFLWIITCCALAH